MRRIKQNKASNRRVRSAIEGLRIRQPHKRHALTFGGCAGLSNLQNPLKNGQTHCAETHSNRPFLSMAPDRKSYNYSEFESLTNKLTHNFKAHINELTA